MLNKPFKVPLLVQRPSSGSTDVSGPPPHKRRKPSPSEDGDSRPVAAAPDGPQPAAFRAPKISLPPAPSSEILSTVTGLEIEGASQPTHEGRFFSVLWRKPTNKKHKTWDGDGSIAIRDGVVTLHDENGRPIGRTKVMKPLSPGSTFSMSGKDIEIDSLLTRDAFMASKPMSKPTVRELDSQLCTNVKFNSTPALPVDGKETTAEKRVDSLKRASLGAKAAANAFKSPLLDQTSATRPRSDPYSQKTPVPLHDPHAPGAVVMKRPARAPLGKRLVDVVIDPLLAKSLRDHQKDGVKFLYECVMGIKHQGMGGILADEMGLGKSLQVIALLWTLMKQNPVYGDPPVVQKAVIVCPATLIRNWKKEIRKWLGEARVGVLAFDDSKMSIRHFTHGKSYQVLVIGYERFRSAQKDLEQGIGVDIIIADEGHRLKTAKNKAGQAIKSLPTDRRIILSGTPLQNDLSELYFVSEIVNPGLLGKPSQFKREFEVPILRATQSDATETQLQTGQARGEELAILTKMFLLRRTMDILADFLPPKSETIIFCRPTSAQASVYKRVLASPAFGSVLGNADTALQFISVLKKVCNSPNLLRAKGDVEEAKTNATIAELLGEIPSGLLKSPGASGKLQVLDSLLYSIRTYTDEKVVIVSHYTSTLDILGNLLSSLGYPFLRLDGSTPTGKRQGIVETFNRTPASANFAFLLSAKSGGAGLNLIGASRLILFDVDWNPSTEDQAMARIHRDGQKRYCRIYRLLVQGALDEKIYQRQLTKRALADSVVDRKHSATNFSREELRGLFSFDDSPECQTHELLGCACGGKGVRRSDGTGELEELSDSDEDDLPALGEVMTASQAMQVPDDRLESRSPKKQGQSEHEQVQALMQYRHIDPRHLEQYADTPDNEAVSTLLNGDDVLRRVLRDGEVNIGYLFTRANI